MPGGICAGRRPRRLPGDAELPVLRRDPAAAGQRPRHTLLRQEVHHTALSQVERCLIS